MKFKIGWNEFSINYVPNRFFNIVVWRDQCQEDWFFVLVIIIFWIRFKYERDIQRPKSGWIFNWRLVGGKELNHSYIKPDPRKKDDRNEQA